MPSFRNEPHLRLPIKPGWRFRHFCRWVIGPRLPLDLRQVRWVPDPADHAPVGQGRTLLEHVLSMLYRSADGRRLEPATLALLARRHGKRLLLHFLLSNPGLPLSCRTAMAADADKLAAKLLEALTVYAEAKTLSVELLPV